MKITNTSNEIVEVCMRDQASVILHRGESVEGDVTNLERIRRNVRIGEDLTEVRKSGIN